jgi:predicted dehydrogenase
MKVGVIGCGQISGIYIETLQKMKNVQVVACADIAPHAAKFRADMYNIPRACTPEQLFRDPRIELVLNTTIPEAHTEINLAALQAGKHVYTEKPLATCREDARRVLELAGKRGLRVGCAPDTFLGAGLQTCLKLVADGAIGTPVAAFAFMMHHGPEAQAGKTPKPESPTRQRVTPKDPGHYYVPGWGPLFDMGPYYLTALVTIIGPIRRATGSARITWPERPVGAPQYKVHVPSHIAGVLDHENGAVTTIVTSTDVWPAGFPHIEIHGAKGSLRTPDPNTFGGPVRYRAANEKEWREMPLTHGYAQDSRGLGVAEMVASIRLGRTPRACGEMALHVVDIAQAIHEASRENRHIQVTSSFTRPAPLRPGLAVGEID